MSDITFVVEIFFSFDRPNRILSPEWVEERFKLFEQYTLRSLLNQSFQDFRIFILCGERNRHITEKLPWHPRVEVYHVEGESRLSFPKRMRPTSKIAGYGSIDTEYLAITRCDSDDIYHKDLMAEVRDSVFLDSRRSALVVKNYIIWDILCHYIIYYDRPQVTPYFTHVFPRSIYKSWNDFMTQHYLNFRFAGLDLPTTKEIGKFRVCTIRHSQNISDTKHKGRTLKWKGEKIIDKAVIAESLKDFGLKEVYGT